MRKTVTKDDPSNEILQVWNKKKHVHVNNIYITEIIPKNVSETNITRAMLLLFTICKILQYMCILLDIKVYCVKSNIFLFGDTLKINTNYTIHVSIIISS